MVFVRWLHSSSPPHRILSVCHVLAGRSMEKQPASYMHENWQSGLGAACEPFEFWKPRPTSAAASTTPPTLCFSKCPPLPTDTLPLFQYPSVPPISCFSKCPPAGCHRRPLSTVKIVYEVTTGYRYKQLVSRLRPIGCRLYNKCVYLDETGDLNATCRVEPSFTFRGWEIVERPSWESIQSGDFCYS